MADESLEELRDRLERMEFEKNYAIGTLSSSRSLSLLLILSLFSSCSLSLLLMLCSESLSSVQEEMEKIEKTLRIERSLRKDLGHTHTRTH